MNSESGRPIHPAWFVLAALLLASGAVLLAAQSQMTFIYDDWFFLIHRRGSGVDAFLDPYNEHIVVSQVAIYKLVLGAFGMDSARPLQVVSDLLVLSCGALLFAYARTRVGDWLALVAAALILFFGAAWLDLLWPVNLALSGGCAAGLGALLALDRDDRAGDIAAVALLAISVSFSEVGVAFSVGALVAVLLADRPWCRRLYVGLAPLLVYAAWWAGWGHEADSSFSLDNVIGSPVYVFDAVSQALAALLGFATPLSGDASELVGINWGRALLVIAIVLSVLRLRGRPVPTGVWVALAAGAAFWFSAAFNENELRPPESARVLLPSGIFILLIAAEVLRGLRLGSSGLLVAAGATAIALGHMSFRDGTTVFENVSDSVRADLAAAERTSEANPNHVLSAFPWLLPVSTVDYLAAVDDYGGSPAFSEAELLSASTPARASADNVFSSALGLRLEFTPPGRLPAAPSEPGCRTVPASAGGQTPIEFGPGRVDMAGAGAEGTRVLLTRYSLDAYSVDLGTLPSQPVTLEVPADRSSQPWLLGLKGEGPVVVCVRPQ